MNLMTVPFSRRSRCRSRVSSPSARDRRRGGSCRHRHPVHVGATAGAVVAQPGQPTDSGAREARTAEAFGDVPDASGVEVGTALLGRADGVALALVDIAERQQARTVSRTGEDALDAHEDTFSVLVVQW